LQEGRIAGRCGQKGHIALGHEKVPTPHILVKLEEFVKESVNCSLEVCLLAASWIDIIILTHASTGSDSLKGYIAC
jgi:hypothetical protein